MQEREKKEELFIVRKAAWIGGVLEGGADISFVQVKDKTRESSLTPRIFFSSSNQLIHQGLGQLIPSDSRLPGQYRMHGWHIYGERAIQLAKVVAPYAPSLSESLAVIQRWDTMSSIEQENVVSQIADEGKHAKRVDVDTAVYEKLFHEKPEFLAGLIDSRGNINSVLSHRKTKMVPTIALNSQIPHLLEALVNTYTGGIFYSRRGNKGSTPYWRIDNQAAVQLYEDIKDHLLLRAERAKELFEPFTVYYTNREQDAEEYDKRIHAHAKWLAGFFDVGGTLSFGGTHPQAQLGDNSEERLKKFKKIIGGSMSPPSPSKENSEAWHWSLHGGKVLVVADAIRPYALSRDEFLDLASIWENLSTEEKIAWADDFVQEDRDMKRQVKDVQRYTSLIEDPEFLAGVLDNRGYFFLLTRSAQKRTIERAITVHSLNKALIESLKSRYGGTISLETEIMGRKVRPSYTWEVRRDKARAVYKKVKSSLQLRDDEAKEAFE